MDDGALFTPPPRPEALEWPGTPIGIANVITQTCGEVPVNRGLKPEEADGLLQLVRRRLEGAEAYVQDAVIHGVTVRLFSNLHHVADFWRDNWFGAKEWRGLTGLTADRTPQVTLWAVGGVPNRGPQVVACPARNLIFIINGAHYAIPRAEALAAVARILADQKGIFSMRASSVASDDQGLLYIGPGHTTTAFELMRLSGTRFHSDDRAFIRCVYRDTHGRWAAPTAVTGSDGSSAQGYRVFDWLARNGKDRKARVSVLYETETAPVETALENLELHTLKALIYPSERRAYVRTDIVKKFPGHLGAILRCKLENVPEAGPSPAPADEAARLTRFDGARAMIDPEAVFGKARVCRNPMEPVFLASVVTGAPGSAGDLQIQRMIGVSEVDETLFGLLKKCAEFTESLSVSKVERRQTDRAKAQKGATA